MGVDSRALNMHVRIASLVRLLKQDRRQNRGQNLLSENGQKLAIAFKCVIFLPSSTRGAKLNHVCSCTRTRHRAEQQTCTGKLSDHVLGHFHPQRCSATSDLINLQAPLPSR